MDAPSAPSPLASASRGALAAAWDRLVAPSPALESVADRMRARLLAGLLAVVVTGGLASGFVQLALVPGFWPTFLAMLVALAALAAGYAASRTRHYRAGGWAAAIAPIAASAAAAALNPDDRVWFAFMSLGVLLAAVFLSLKATAAVAALAVAAILLLAAFVPELRAPERLQRVVLNLAVNARDAMPGGGRFTLETANAELDAAATERRPGLRPGPHVRLTAADDGVGMAPEVAAHAFEPFFTTKPAGAGTGLGLASVWGIVTQAGGHVGVESEPGRGTRFEIHLPRAAAPPG